MEDLARAMTRARWKVEGMVGYMRRNFLVPVPSFQSFDALNAHLEERS